MVEHILGKDAAQVRFLLGAPSCAAADLRNSRNTSKRITKKRGHATLADVVIAVV